MYRAFYGLRENPFSVTSDPSFLFLSSTHEEALDHLRYGIEQRKGFLAITGEIGSGKTTLCKALLTRLDSRHKVALILNSILPDTQLLEAIVEDFGLPVERRTKVGLIKTLNAFLLQQLAAGHNAVLIIDEAQNLRHSALETVRMLSNLETDKEKLLQIVLVGQPQLKEKLNAPALAQMKQRIAVRFHIRALDETEVARYIGHRLAIAGARNGLRFDDDAIRAIHAHTGGIPRLINILADRALLRGFVKDLLVLDRAHIKECIAELEGDSTSPLLPPRP